MIMNYSETKALFDSIYEEELLSIKHQSSIVNNGYVSKTYDFLGENHYNAGKMATNIPIIERRVVFVIEELLLKKKMFYHENEYVPCLKSNELYPLYSFFRIKKDDEFVYLFEESQKEEINRRSYLVKHLDELLAFYKINKIVCIKFSESLPEYSIPLPSKLEFVCLNDFLSTYFSKDEFNAFVDSKNQFMRNAKSIIGYKTIKTLDYTNGYQLKQHIKEEMCEMITENLKYSIIDREFLMKKGRYDLIECVKNQICDSFTKDFLLYFNTNNGVEILLGNKTFSQSFITSEWLFNSLIDKKGFDYTSVISGYLKSIEQLLYMIVCYYNENYDSKYWILTKEKEEKLVKDLKMIDKKDYYVRRIKDKKYIYVKLSKANKEIIDYSLNSYITFFRWQILQNSFDAKINADMANELYKLLNCYRIECRNGYFHTDNLIDEVKARKARENTIYLYFLIISFLKIDDNMKNYLGVQKTDYFNNLRETIIRCKKNNNKFLLVYPNTSYFVAFNYSYNPRNFTDNLFEQYDIYYFEKYPEITKSNANPNRVSISSIPGFRAKSKNDDIIITVTRDNHPSKIIWIDQEEKQHLIYSSI